MIYSFSLKLNGKYVGGKAVAENGVITYAQGGYSKFIDQPAVNLVEWLKNKNYNIWVQSASGADRTRIHNGNGN